MSINFQNIVLIVARARWGDMKMLTVSLFGHRQVDDLWRMEERLHSILKNLIGATEYINFLIGRNGEFDEHVASVIKRVQKEIGQENSSITLVLPYRMADLEYYEKYYDDIVIPDELHGAHPKSAITLRNRWMIEQSDLVIVYVARDRGGAFAAMNYAKKMNKGFINLFVRETASPLENEKR